MINDRRTRMIRRAARVLSKLNPTAAAQMLVRLNRVPARAELPRGQALWVERSRQADYVHNEYRIRTYTWGDPGPRILLVHGWGGRGAQLGNYASALVKAGFQVMAFDGIAQGESSGRETDPWECCRLVEALGRTYGPFHGMITHSLASLYGAWAIREGIPVKRVVMLGPFDDISARLRASGVYLGFAPEVIGVAEKILVQKAKTHTHDFRDLQISSYAHRLKNTEALFFYDLDDDEVPYEEVKHLVDAWPGGSLRVTKGFGHFWQIRDPRTMRGVVEYLREA